jgi:hypothetical protein
MGSVFWTGVAIIVTPTALGLLFFSDLFTLVQQWQRHRVCAHEVALLAVGLQGGPGDARRVHAIGIQLVLGLDVYAEDLRVYMDRGGIEVAVRGPFDARSVKALVRRILRHPAWPPELGLEIRRAKDATVPWTSP